MVFFLTSERLNYKLRRLKTRITKRGKVCRCRLDIIQVSDEVRGGVKVQEEIVGFQARRGGGLGSGWVVAVPGGEGGGAGRRRAAFRALPETQR